MWLRKWEGELCLETRIAGADKAEVLGLEYP